MQIITVYVNRADDPEATILFNRLQRTGYEDLAGVTIERVYRLQGDIDVSKLIRLFVNPVFETYSDHSHLDPAAGPVIEVGYQRAVTDPETPSILEAARILGQQGLEWARLSHRYQFSGVTPDRAEAIVREYLYNPVVQAIISPGTTWQSLHPTGEADDVRSISLTDLSDDELIALSDSNSWYAPLEQMQALQEYERRRQRPLTDAEIEVVVQSWSDHCYHTTWKSLGLLEKLKQATRKIDHPLLVSVFSDNAGGIEFYDNQVITIKGETHNFPSSIATFGGVATKHGGVIRDTIGFGKGGYPIGGSTVMGTMNPVDTHSKLPPGALPPGHIVRESIRATSYYCNPMGIPMMYPAYRMHPGYPKCLALGHSIGIIPREYALKEDPEPGDALLLFGGRTGRDGIHGATASSAHMTGRTAEKDSAAVQIGHPITERKFMEAVPRLRDAGCIRSLTDLGAGGISCAAGEMGSNTGVLLALNKVPLKDQSLTAWEILLSESQERMLAAVPREKLDQAVRILDEYGVESAVIGEFTDSHHLEAVWNGKKVTDLDMGFLWGQCPIKETETHQPNRNLNATTIRPPEDLHDLARRAKRVLAHYNCCDQSPAGFQFDSTVQGRTVVGPYGGKDGRMPTDVFVAAPLRGKRYGVMSSIAYNPFYGDIDPVALGRLMMIEAISRAVAAGANPAAIALCDNFYTPSINPELAWDLTRTVETMARLSQELGTPFISGKDSSSGTFITGNGERVNVPFTVVVATLCRIPDVTRVLTKELKQPGNQLILVGRLDPDLLGGSVYLDCYGQRGSKLSDWGNEWAAGLLPVWQRLHALISDPHTPVRAAAATGEGGVFKKTFEMAYGGRLGADLDLTAWGPARRDGILFSEAIGSFIVEIEAGADPDDLFAGIEHTPLGTVTASRCISLKDGDDGLALRIEDLVAAWESTFKDVVL